MLLIYYYYYLIYRSIFKFTNSPTNVLFGPDSILNLILCLVIRNFVSLSPWTQHLWVITKFWFKVLGKNITELSFCTSQGTFEERCVAMLNYFHFVFHSFFHWQLSNISGGIFWDPVNTGFFIIPLVVNFSIYGWLFFETIVTMIFRKW